MSRILLFSIILFVLQNSYANEFSTTSNFGEITFEGMIIDSTCPITSINNLCISNLSEEEKKLVIASHEIMKVILYKENNPSNNAELAIEASKNILNHNPNLELYKINNNSLLMTINYD